MDIADESFIRLWRTLAKYGVRYIMLGGIATNLHGFSRTTADADLYLEDTPDNRKRFGSALEELGIAPKELVQRLQFIPGWSALPLENGFPLDVMTEVKGLENIPFNECYESASKAEIEGVLVPFLHINHLILSKQAVNLPKDQIDIAELQRIKKYSSGST